jgi:hypothetical protein
MRKLFILILFLFCGTLLNAQDTIFKKGGGFIPCKVTEVGEVIIFNQNAAGTNSRFAISKSEINSIHYANGTRDYFNQASQQMENSSMLDEKPFLPLYQVAIYTELMKMVISEVNIGLTYRFNRYVGLDLNVGHIYYNPVFDPFILSPSQNDWPGTVYKGTSYRLGIKIFPNPGKRNYIAIKGLLKTMYYSGINFLDMTNGYSITTLRSESAVVKGMEVEGGKEFITAEGHLLIEVFYGIGIRLKERNYTTYSEMLDGRFNVPAGQGAYPIGSFTKTQVFPTLELGFKMGFCFGKPRHE